MLGKTIFRGVVGGKNSTLFSRAATFSAKILPNPDLNQLYAPAYGSRQKSSFTSGPITIVVVGRHDKIKLTISSVCISILLTGAVYLSNFISFYL